MATSEAADLAATLRAERVAVVSELTAGILDGPGLIADSRAVRVKTVVLAQAVPGLGKVRSRAILDRLGIDHATRWGELDGEVRALLVNELWNIPATAGGASPTGGR